MNVKRRSMSVERSRWKRYVHMHLHPCISISVVFRLLFSGVLMLCTTFNSRSTMPLPGVRRTAAPDVVPHPPHPAAATS